MKTIYKGHEIDVRRERSMGGDELLYYSVFRLSDGYECVSSFTTGGDTVKEYIGYMKERIDAELADPDPWCEESGKYPLGYMQQRGAA
jgi:hypothetical protein